LDETGFNLHTQSEYGWAPGNLVPIVPLNPNRGRNCTLVLAISQFGVEGYEVFAGACNAERLTNFILNKLNPNIRDRNPYLFMDNVRFHHSASFRQALDGNITLRHIPPYSPKLNAIEEVFSLVKYNYKRQKISRPEDLIQGVIQAVQSLQVRENLLPFYRSFNR